jgi:TonB family protein
VGAVELAPTEIEPFRIAGETSIVPADLDRVNLPVGARARGRFQLCLDTTGKPTSVAVTNTTGIANYDRKIVDRMWKWAFNPILVDGKPAKVCSQVTFLFEQTRPVVIERH